jgi:1-acyl-sn-glycerol-3-phosphate acyltransferase
MDGGGLWLALCPKTSLLPLPDESRSRPGGFAGHLPTMHQPLSPPHRHASGWVGCPKSKPPGRFYDFWKVVWRGVSAFTMRVKSTGVDRVRRHGGMLIAVSHVSHLDPIVISAVIKRLISWMSRVEFYQQWLMRNVLYQGGAFQVDRAGSALPAIREWLRRLGRGEAVGILR